MYWYFRVYPNLEAWDFPLLTPNCIFQTVAKCCQELTIHGRSLLSPQKHNRDRETIICDWEIRCGIITPSLKQKPSRNIFINFREHIFGGTRRLVIDNNESRHPVLVFRTVHAVSLILYNCWSFYSDIILDALLLFSLCGTVTLAFLSCPLHYWRLSISHIIASISLVV